MEFGEIINIIGNPKAVISGSFRKHLEQISNAMDCFKRIGVKVLAPATKEPVGADDEFVILVTDDPDKPPHCTVKVVDMFA